MKTKHFQLTGNLHTDFFYCSPKVKTPIFFPRKALLNVQCTLLVRIANIQNFAGCCERPHDYIGVAQA